MMGYTHAAIGAAGALSLAALNGNGSPTIYITASLAGALGGVAVDIDTRDNLTNPKITDAGRTRLAIVGLLGISILLDWFFKTGILMTAISRQYTALTGLIVFAVALLIGVFSPRRTFSHSLLFIAITTIGVYCIYPDAATYYFVGGVLHLLFDMLNNPFNNHGVWLLYPIKTGKGIALGICKAARTGNKICYFAGIILFVGMSVFYFWRIGDVMKAISPAIVLVYMVVAMHFVRQKSEKEQRHIMHMRGEL